MTINKLILFYSFILFFLSTCVLKGEDPKGLSVGDRAPIFSAVDQFNNIFNLEAQLKQGPVVLMFYRGHWCKYCNRQLEHLSDSLEYIFKKGASVITVTPEIMEFVDETSEKYQNSFRIISDTEMKIMELYKVNFKVNGATNTKYKISGINLNVFNGDNGPNLPVPATYIIGQNGIIKYVFFKEDYTKRVSMETILINL